MFAQKGELFTQPNPDQVVTMNAFVQISSYFKKINN
jgi:hypothetical protein